MNAGLTELRANINTCFCMLPNSNAACARSSRADDKLALADFYTNSECACELDFFFFFCKPWIFFLSAWLPVLCPGAMGVLRRFCDRSPSLIDFNFLEMRPAIY